MRHKKAGFLIGLTAALAAAYPALADTTPEDANDYRAAVMTALRGHIGAASMIARGLVDDTGQLLGHAEGLSNAAAELKNLWPEGSAVEGSDSLPAIWSDPEKFSAAIDAMVTATGEFEAAAASGDRAAIGAAFRQVGMGCRGCHDNFRRSDD